MMTGDDVKVYKAMKALHDELFPVLRALKRETSDCKNLERLADRCLAMRQAMKYLEQVRADMRDIDKLAEKLTCLLWMHLGLTESVKTDYGTMIPNVRMMSAIPKKSKSPAEYEAVMEYLKIPPELYRGEIEAVRLHWPGMVEYLSNLLADGRELPHGLDPDKTYPVYSLTCRKSAEIDEE